MTAPRARLLFDECFGAPAIRGLAKLAEIGGGEKPEVRHLFDFRPSGTRDEDWIPLLAPQGWTVITTDGGKKPNRKRGEKLPRLCARHAVTHVILSPTIHNRTSFEKLLTVLSVWYELLDLAADKERRGFRYLLEPLSSGERGRGRLVHKTLSASLLALRDEYMSAHPETREPESASEETSGCHPETPNPSSQGP